MVPGDVDPNILSGRWRLSIADYFMPRRKAPAAKSASGKPAGNSPRPCCPPDCCS